MYTNPMLLGSTLPALALLDLLHLLLAALLPQSLAELGEAGGRDIEPAPDSELCWEVLGEPVEVPALILAKSRVWISRNATRRKSDGVREPQLDPPAVELWVAGEAGPDVVDERHASAREEPGVAEAVDARKVDALELEEPRQLVGRSTSAVPEPQLSGLGPRSGGTLAGLKVGGGGECFPGSASGELHPVASVELDAGEVAEAVVEVTVGDEGEVEVESFARIRAHSSPDAKHDPVLDRVASPTGIRVRVGRGDPREARALCRAC